MGPERSHDPGDATDNPFRRLRSRTLIPWVIAGGISLGLVLAFAGSPSTMDPLDSPIAALIAGLALYGLPGAWIVWACRRVDIDLGRLIGRVPAGYNWLPAVGLLATKAMFSFGLWSVAGYGLSQFAPEFLESLLASEDPVVDSPAVISVRMVLLITIIPITGEVLFRGVLLSRWGVKWGIGTGIVVTAVIFALLNLVDAVEATALGVIAALLYLQSRTLIVPIAFHAANNLVAKVVGDALAWEEGLAPAAKLEEIEAMALPGLAMLAVTLPVLVWYIRRNWPSRDAEIPYMRNAG